MGAVLERDIHPRGGELAREAAPPELPEPPHFPDPPEITAPPRTALVEQALRWSREHPLVTRRFIAAVMAVAAVAVAVVALVVPNRSGEAGVAEAQPATVIDPDLVRVATATMPLVDVYDRPDGGHAILTLENPSRGGGPLVFLIEGEWQGWYKVQVPAPPAGTTGWVRADVVEVDEHHVRITIDLDEHLLVARDGGEIVLRAPISIGRHDKPQPGTTFVTGRVAFPTRNPGYGTHALALAGYDNGQETFFRGTGLVGLHGVTDALDLGQTVMDGSIGLANEDAATLYELVPLGTRVDIIGDEV